MDECYDLTVSENELFEFLNNDGTTYNVFDSDDDLQQLVQQEQLLQQQEQKQQSLVNPFYNVPDYFFSRIIQPPFDELLFTQDQDQEDQQQEEQELCRPHKKQRTTYEPLNPPPVLPTRYSGMQKYKAFYGEPCAMTATPQKMKPHRLMNGPKWKSVKPTEGSKPSTACTYCRSIRKHCTSFPGNGRCARCRSKGPEMVCVFESRWSEWLNSNLDHPYYPYVKTPWLMGTSEAFEDPHL